MLRLHQIFLINVVVIFTVLVGIMLGMSYYSTKQIDISAQKSNLRKSIGITKQLLIANSSGESMDQFVQKIKKLSGYRVTLIDEKGVVIAETDSDKGLMVNHLTRPEIMQSMREEIGLEVRHSTTINKDLVYVATKVDINHSVVYLRLAAEVSGYEQYLYALWYQIAYVFVFALMIAIFFSYRINKRIEGQISNIASYLIELEKKNFKATIKPAFAKEFYSIAEVLMLLTRKLEKQENQKKKYTTKLKLKNKQATDIVEAIAHEFKNPVAAVMGYTETIMNDPQMDQKIRDKFLEKAHMNALMISKMIDRLALSLRLENNSVEINPEKFMFKSLLEDTREQLLQRYKKRTITIECDDFSLIADRTLLQLAIVNLTDNALKYSEGEVAIKAIKEAEQVRVEVVDHGIGIPEKEMENITKKFYRVSKNGWDNSLGLGLALVKYVLKLHSSDLEIVSKPSIGSTFIFTISDYGSSQSN